MLRQRFEGPAVDPQRILAQGRQGAGGDFRRDKGMTIAVPADPGAEPDQGRQRIHPGRIESRRDPRFPQVQMGPAQGLGEDFAQVMQRILQLGLDGGPGDVDFPRPPQVFQMRFQLAFQPGLLPRGVDGIFMPIHQRIDLAMQLPHRFALGLRGVGRQHRFYLHIAQHRQQLRLGQPQFAQLLQIIRPQPLLRRSPLLFLPQAAHLRGHPFLHHVQQLKGNGIRLPQRPVGRGRPLRRVPQPWQLLRQFRLPQPPQHRREGFHQESEFNIKELESEGAQGNGGRRHERPIPAETMPARRKVRPEGEIDDPEDGLSSGVAIGKAAGDRSLMERPPSQSIVPLLFKLIEFR